MYRSDQRFGRSPWIGHRVFERRDDGHPRCHRLCQTGRYSGETRLLGETRRRAAHGTARGTRSVFVRTRNNRPFILSALWTRFVQVTGKCGSVCVRLIPAPRGTGTVSAQIAKKLLTMAGIEDCYTTATTGAIVNFGEFSEMRIRSVGRTTIRFERYDLTRPSMIFQSWRRTVRLPERTVLFDTRFVNAGDNSPFSESSEHLFSTPGR